MNRSLTIAALCGLSASFLGPRALAQTPAGETTRIGASGTQLQDKFDAIRERRQKVQQEFEEKLRRAKDEGEKAELLRRRRGAEFLPEFKALALECKGTDVAAQCWLKVCEIGLEFEKHAEAIAAIDALMKEHVQSPLLEVLPMLVHDLNGELGGARTEKTLRDLAQQSTHAAVKANAWFELAREYLRPDFEEVERRPHARLLFERLSKEFGDEASPYGQPYKEVAEQFLFEIDHLQIGMEAPDFEAADETGKTFKLRDYRGKVVVLDFWGLWCDPCRAALPREKALVKTLAGQPFALIGINSDGDSGVVEQIVAEQQITWRQAIEGSQQGPLATRWNVREWPTTYVIDKKGVIRFKHLRSAKLEEAVTKLLGEIEAAK